MYRFLVDPFVEFLPDTFGCDLTAMYSEYSPVVYYAIYLNAIRYLLVNSFKGSSFALSRIQQGALQIPVFLMLALPIIYCLFETTMSSRMSDKSCLQRWTPPDTDYHLIYCKIGFDENLRNWVLVITLCLIHGFHLVMMTMFCMRLKKLLSAQQNISHCASELEDLTLKLLSIKFTILGLFAAVSAIILVVLYMVLLYTVASTATFVYCALLINNITFGLLSKINENRYKWCCKYPILCCLLDLDKSASQLSATQSLEYVASTLSPESLCKTPKIVITVAAEKENHSTPQSPIGSIGTESPASFSIDMTALALSEANISPDGVHQLAHAHSPNMSSPDSRPERV